MTKCRKTDRPIIFSAPMALALLDGRKTQTRRLATLGSVSNHYTPLTQPIGDSTRPSPWRKAQPGDRLWVREAWAHYQTVNYVRRHHGGASSEVSDGLAGYRADGHDTIEDFRQHIRLMSGCDLEAIEINGNRWRPSIHMPRWASRLTLTVTDVRVQRLQEISEEDAMAEGVEREVFPPAWPTMYERVYWKGYENRQKAHRNTAVESYSSLWNSLHGPGAWDANPHVVALTFSVARRNIDAP